VSEKLHGNHLRLHVVRFRAVFKSRAGRVHLPPRAQNSAFQRLELSALASGAGRAVKNSDRLLEELTPEQPCPKPA
jgi:hypothetical protein